MHILISEVIYQSFSGEIDETKALLLGKEAIISSPTPAIFPSIIKKINIIVVACCYLVNLLLKKSVGGFNAISLFSVFVILKDKSGLWKQMLAAKLTQIN